MRAALIIVSACTLAIGLWSGGGIPITPEEIDFPLTTARHKLIKEDPAKHAEVITLLDECIRKTKKRDNHFSKVLGEAYALCCIVGGIGLFWGIGSPWRAKPSDAA